MRGSPVFMQICLYIIEKILENRQTRPNLGTRPVLSCLVSDVLSLEKRHILFQLHFIVRLYGRID